MKHLLTNSFALLFSLESDKFKLKKLDKKVFMIRNGDTDDDWRIQSHFIGTDHYIEELESEIDEHLRYIGRKSLSDDEKEICTIKIMGISRDFDNFLCYISENYDNENDLNKIQSDLRFLFSNISKLYNQSLSSFENMATDETYQKFYRLRQAYERGEKIDEILN